MQAAGSHGHTHAGLYWPLNPVVHFLSLPELLVFLSVLCSALEGLHAGGLGMHLLSQCLTECWHPAEPC